MADDLTDPERRLRDAIDAGGCVEFSDSEHPELEDAALGATWGPERSVPAHVLIELLTRSPREKQARPLRLAGARITGTFDMEGLLLLRPLTLERCFCDEPVRLDDTRAPRVELKSCRLPALSARQFEVRGDCVLDGLIGAQEVVLAGARIGGVLSLRAAQVENRHGIALNGERLEVNLGIDCSHLQTTGEVRLSGTHVGGHLTLDAARLRNEGGLALDATGLQVGGDVSCEARDGHRFEAIGELSLSVAHVGGRVSLLGACLSNELGPALQATGLQVGGDMICMATHEHRFEATGEVNLSSAHVNGQLMMFGARLSNGDGAAMTAYNLQVDEHVFCAPMAAQRFEATGKVQLDGAQIGGMLVFAGARLHNGNGPALTANFVHVGQDMSCAKRDGHRFEAIGEVQLFRAHVGGHLSFSGAYIFGERAKALAAARLRVDGDMLCSTHEGQRFEAVGEIWLSGAQIGGNLGMHGALLSHEGGRSLNAIDMRVDQSVYCVAENGQRFEAVGEVQLTGTHVAGSLSFIGASLSNANGLALNAVALHVNGDMICAAIEGQPFEATGEVQLAQTHIGRALVFEGAQLSNANRLALGLQAIEARELWLPRTYAPVALVDLTDAMVGQLHDGWRPSRHGGFSHQYSLRVAGLTYQSLGPESSDCDARLDWLRHVDEGYVPQAYDQLAAVFSRAGREEDAHRVAIAKQRRRRANLVGPAKAGSYFLDVAVGYGYRTWRGLFALVAMILVGWAVFASAFPEHLRATRPAAQLPRFHAWLYSIDAVLPLVNLGQKNAWTPTGAAQLWYAFSVLVGWLLGLGLVAFFTARLFRD